MAINQSVADICIYVYVFIFFSLVSSFFLCSTNFQMNANTKNTNQSTGVRFSFLSCFFRKYFCFSTSFSYHFCCVFHTIRRRRRRHRGRKNNNIKESSEHFVFTHRTQMRWNKTECVLLRKLRLK